MADVFISYKREERQVVERIAQELRELGLDVWFDASLTAGEAFSDEIDREARSAKAVLVCWSATARESQWVKAEALIGFNQKKLTACYVAGPDAFDPPTPFNTIHTADLRAWLVAPSAMHREWRAILRAIGRLCGREDIETWGALDEAATANELRSWLAVHEHSTLFLSVDALLRKREQQDAERTLLRQEAHARRAQLAERARSKWIVGSLIVLTVMSFAGMLLPPRPQGTPFRVGAPDGVWLPFGSGISEAEGRQAARVAYEGRHHLAHRTARTRLEDLGHDWDSGSATASAVLVGASVDLLSCNWPLSTLCRWGVEKQRHERLRLYRIARRFSPARTRDSVFPGANSLWELADNVVIATPGLLLVMVAMTALTIGTAAVGFSHSSRLLAAVPWALYNVAVETWRIEQAVIDAALDHPDQFVGREVGQTAMSAASGDFLVAIDIAGHDISIGWSLLSGALALIIYWLIGPPLFVRPPHTNVGGLVISTCSGCAAAFGLQAIITFVVQRLALVSAGSAFDLSGLSGAGLPDAVVGAVCMGITTLFWALSLRPLRKSESR